MNNKLFGMEILKKSIIGTFVLFFMVSFSLAQQKKELKPGDPAPELAFKSPEGKIIKLSSLQGKVVLVDFWASWCYPCRVENPSLVKAYEKYKDKIFTHGNGFTIYSVSLDDKKKHWMKAIKKDKLEWPNHVSDLKRWQAEGGLIYNVIEIPTNYLIDKDGKILAKNLKGESLAEYLESIVAK